MQVQKLCASKQGYAGACPPRPAVAAEALEREYCYRLHSEWPLLDALHAQLDHLSAHERKKRLRLLQVCAALAIWASIVSRSSSRQLIQLRVTINPNCSLATSLASSTTSMYQACTPVRGLATATETTFHGMLLVYGIWIGHRALWWYSTGIVQHRTVVQTRSPGISRISAVQLPIEVAPV